MNLMHIKRLSLSTFLLAIMVMYALIMFLGYTFVAGKMSGIVLNALIGAIVIRLTVTGIKRRDEQSKADATLSTFLPVIVMLFLALKGLATDTNTLSYILLSFVVLLCSFIVFRLCARKSILKTSIGCAGILLLIPTLFMLFALLFGTVFMSGFGAEWAEVSKPSPNGRYLAEIIAHSQGALGGATMVHVTRQNSNVDIFIGEFQATPRQLYSGRWGEFYSMDLRWETDDMLHVYFQNFRETYIRQWGRWRLVR